MSHGPGDDVIHDRTRRLLQFLRELQAFRRKPALSLDRYPRILWGHQLPPGSGVHVAGAASEPHVQAEQDGPWLAIERPGAPDPPAPPEIVAPWITPKALHNATLEAPPLLDETLYPDQAASERETDIDDIQTEWTRDPSVDIAYAEWLPTWTAWRAHELALRPVRAAYRALYELHRLHRDNTGTYELVLGIGLLEGHRGRARIRRHVITIPVACDLDVDSGLLSVVPDFGERSARLEQDMLDPAERVASDTIERLQSQLDAVGGILDLDAIFAVARSWAHAFRSDVSVVNSLRPTGDPEGSGTVSLAPAFIVRPVGAESYTRAFNTIELALDSGASLPPNLRAVVADLDATGEPRDGNRQTLDDDPIYFARHANEEQLEVIRNLRKASVVAVQGPPGTGKTHTIVNIVTDLLAHGQRVLITSKTGQALRLVRDMLPDEMRGLCVDSSSTRTRTQEDLQRSVDALLAGLGRDNERTLDEDYVRLSERLDAVEAERTATITRLGSMLEWERTELPPINGKYGGTPTSIASQLAADAAQYGSFGRVRLSGPRISAAEVARLDMLHHAARDAQKWPETGLPPRSSVPTPDEFATIARRRAEARIDLDQMSADAEHPVRMGRASPSQIDVLERLTTSILHELREVRAGGYRWIDTALRQVYTGRYVTWNQHVVELAGELDLIRTDLAVVAASQVTGLDAIDPADAHIRLRDLFEHLAAGRKLTRIGRPVAIARQCADLLRNIRVDGEECRTKETVAVAAAECRVLARLRQAETDWSLDGGGSPRIRLARLQDALSVLERIMRIRESFEPARELSQRVGIEEPLWHDPRWVASLDATLRADRVRTELADAEGRLDRIARDLAAATGQERSVSAAALLEASRARDTKAYTIAYRQLEVRWQAQADAAERRALISKLGKTWPDAAAALLDGSSDPRWRRLLADPDAACAWAARDGWLAEQVDPTAGASLRNSLKAAEERRQTMMTRVAENRAWRYCQSRMSAEEKRQLKTYATMAKKVGKGTGPMAVSYLRQARDAMAKAHSAVPAWIMPLQSVVDTVPFDRPGLFDVVIVDEASQLGHEALVLLWLAKKILVVGDVEQISPEDTGFEHGPIDSLRGELLHDLPASSLFTARGSFLEHVDPLATASSMLREHFRCMPEIIQFSNGLAYQGRLLPMRQYGTDRLPPTADTYIRHATLAGEPGTYWNPAEAEEVVTTIETCCKDPAYDGKTMGVVTLYGTKQADKIRQLILDRIDTDEIERRQLRVDKPEGFQGDERDVMFISMVVARRTAKGPSVVRAVTGMADKRRFNVAASRARDRVWLFHSVRLDELSSEDLRHQYLASLRRAPQQQTADVGEVQPDVPNDRFDSLFEQRVYLALVERGYRVRPQYPVGRYRIDLVVEGGLDRLAIECDGDRYHTSENEVSDIQRQRELESLGWEFERIRGSAFQRDPERAMEPIWATLDRKGIQPVTEVPSSHESFEVSALGENVAPSPTPRSAGPEPAADTTTSQAHEAGTVGFASHPPASAQPAHRTPQDADAAPPTPVVRRQWTAAVVGRRSLDRIRDEVGQIRAWLDRGLTETQVLETRVRHDAVRMHRQREEQLRKRLGKLESFVTSCSVVADAELPDHYWPGAKVTYFDHTLGEESTIVVADIGEWDVDFSARSDTEIGEQIIEARVDQTIVYTANGVEHKIQILGFSD